MECKIDFLDSGISVRVENYDRKRGLRERETEIERTRKREREI